MTLAGIHQPHYLPWLRYFEKIDACDVYILLDTVQYNKNGWQNRNKIKTPDGEAILTVPVHAHLDSAIAAIPIDNTRDWRRRHWKTIRQHYAGAAFFDDYAEPLAEFYERDWTSLVELNHAMLRFFLETLGIETPIRLASELNVPGEATERLVNLVRAVGADAYYSGAFALDAYLDAEAFDAAGIALTLQQWSAPEYPQRYGDFIPDLSILDLLMNCGPQSLNWIRTGGGRV